MNPELGSPNVGLLAASELANFLLRTTVEWLFCLLLVRIAGSAKMRFNLWLGLLLGFVVQWIWMAAAIVRDAAPAITAMSTGGAARSGPAAVGEHVAVAAGLAGMASRYMAVLAALYAAVVAWRVLGAVAARARVARAMDFRVAAGESLARSFEEALNRRSEPIWRRCELWVLPGLASPATLGWWRPRVVVPSADVTHAAELEAVFWHELKHVERRDALWNAIARGCCNVLWFHPCVHHAAAKLNAERELACDAAVVREHPQSRDIYASCLVRFARSREMAEERAAVTGIEMASGAALLSARVHAILNGLTKMSAGSRAWRAAVSMLLAAGMVAAVPKLSVLFAAQTAALILPATANVQTVQAATKRPVAMAVRTALAVDTMPVEPETAKMKPMVLIHDESLAAEHRVAMDILTQSTEMEEAGAGGDGHAAASENVGPGRGSSNNRANPSWTAVAVDAAMRAGPLMINDHDADDRH